MQLQPGQQLRHSQPPAAGQSGDGAGRPGGRQDGADEARLEPRRPEPQHLREGERPAELPPSPRGSEHRQHPGSAALQLGPPRLRGGLAQQAARDPRRGGGGHQGGAPPLRRLPVSGGQQPAQLGLGPGPVQGLPQLGLCAGPAVPAVQLLPGPGHFPHGPRHGPRHPLLHSSGPVPGGGAQRTQGQDCLPHRVLGVGPL